MSEIYNDLHALFPSLFITKENRTLWFDRFMGESQEGQTAGTITKPVLKIEPNLSGSWLDPPTNTPDTVGIWAPHIRFPLPSSQTLPPLAPYSLPRRIREVVFTDPELKLLLESRKFTKVEFEPAVFDPIVKNVSSNPLATMDFYLRSSLMDGYITEALLEPIFLLIALMESE